jgi:hypothetical protein
MLGKNMLQDSLDYQLFILQEYFSIGCLLLSKMLGKNMLEDPLDYQLFAEISGQIVVRSRLQQDDLKATEF